MDVLESGSLPSTNIFATHPEHVLSNNFLTLSKNIIPASIINYEHHTTRIHIYKPQSFHETNNSNLLDAHLGKVLWQYSYY